MDNEREQFDAIEAVYNRLGYSIKDGLPMPLPKDQAAPVVVPPPKWGMAFRLYQPEHGLNRWIITSHCGCEVVKDEGELPTGTPCFAPHIFAALDSGLALLRTAQEEAK